MKSLLTLILCFSIATAVMAQEPVQPEGQEQHEQDNVQQGEQNAPVDSIKQLPPELQRELEEIIQGKGEAPDVMLELGGFLIDETRTKAGADFYDRFYAKWSPPQNLYDYTVTITEQPVPGLATKMFIHVNGEQVLEFFLQPKYDVIEELSGLAADHISNYLANYEQIQEQLGGDDMSGTGIY